MSAKTTSTVLIADGSEQETGFPELVRQHAWSWGPIIRDLEPGGMEPINAYCVKFANLCQLLLRVGRLDDALVAAKTAIEMDPVSPFAQQIMGQVHFYRGEYDLAKEWTQKWSGSDPRSGAALAYLASAYWMTGMELEARATAQASVSADSSELALGLLGYLCARTGDDKKARDLLPPVTSTGGGWLYTAAWIHLGLGDQESALDRLEKSLGSRPGTWSFIAVDPFWDPLRSEPRFPALMRQLGLEPEL